MERRFGMMKGGAGAVTEPAAEGLELVQDGLATVREAEAFLGLRRSTLYRLMEAGQLAYVRIGGARRIPRRALMELAARNLVQPGRAVGS